MTTKERRRESNTKKRINTKELKFKIEGNKILSQYTSINTFYTYKQKPGHVTINFSCLQK